ncbi:MAG TPA: oligosaccharide flippase family protein [Chitinivibrionales bacterium]|nr:oligosaccharide flippase family protein [Chitinivibrionales bacterium]
MPGPENLNLLRLFRGAALYGVSDVVFALVRFLLLAVYTRILAPAEFGTYAIIAATLQLVCIVVPAGIPSAMMVSFRESDPRGMAALRNTSMLFLLQVCIALGAVFFACAHTLFTGTAVSSLAFWLIAWGASEILGMVPKMSLRFNQKIVRFSAARILRVAVMVGVLLWLVEVRAAGLAAVVISEAAAAAAELVFCCIFDGFLPRPAPLAGMGLLLGLGLPLTAVGLGVFLNDLSDRYVVFLLLGKEANGFYAAAAKIALAGSFCAEAFNSMWLPYYFRYAQKKAFHDQELREFSKKLVLLFGALFGFLCIVLPLLVSLRILGRDFVSPAYRGVAAVVAPLTLAYFFKMATYVSTPVLTFRRKILKLSAITGTAAAINIAANVVWCRVFGGSHLYPALTAIALMTSLSYGVCMVWVSHDARLFAMRDWFLSPMTLFCGALLIPAFLPLPVLLKLGLWVVLAAVLYKREFSNSNVLERLIRGQ